MAERSQERSAGERFARTAVVGALGVVAITAALGVGADLLHHPGLFSS